MSSSQPGVPEEDEITASYGLESRNSRIPRLAPQQTITRISTEWVKRPIAQSIWDAPQTKLPNKVKQKEAAKRSICTSRPHGYKTQNQPCFLTRDLSTWQITDMHCGGSMACFFCPAHMDMERLETVHSTQRAGRPLSFRACTVLHH